MSDKEELDIEYTPEFILDNSEEIIKEDCLIIDGRLYEQQAGNEGHNVYRVFYSVDKYAFIEDLGFKEKLNKIFLEEQKKEFPQF